MRVLVCGGREWTDFGVIFDRLLRLRTEAGPDVTVVHGDARGADRLAGQAAKELRLAVQVFPADWECHGKAAGAIRNREMLDTAPDLVLAFHADLTKSKGNRRLRTGGAAAEDCDGGDCGMTTTTSGRLVEVAPAIRRMMRDHGLTHTALAREIGLPQMTVWYWLHGSRAIRPYAEQVARTEARLRRRKAQRQTEK